jgi:tetratricopeptide (TPR) repeat protein
MNNDDLMAALTDWQMAVVLNPEKAEYWYNLGLTSHQLERNDAAIAAFNEVLNLDQSFTKAYSALGNLFYQEKEYARALIYFDRALTFGRDGYLYYNRALTLHQLGRIEEACSDIILASQLGYRGEASDKICPLTE